MKRRWDRSHFDQGDEEPLGPLANLVDLMLVFVCGLVAALLALSPDLSQQLNASQPITPGRELPQIPKGLQGQGEGMEAVGQVYRDPDTNKLILISQ
ncbi:MAG: hypothetical protein V7752_13750 [Halopseudomonas sp.]